MKAIQVVARGRAEFVEIPMPELAPGHALIRTSRLALCGSDIQMLHHAADEAYPFPPGTTGHEMVGTVEAVHAPDSSIRVGDQVLALAPGALLVIGFLKALFNWLEMRKQSREAWAAEAAPAPSEGGAS